MALEAPPPPPDRTKQPDPDPRKAPATGRPEGDSRKNDDTADGGSAGSRKRRDGQR